MKKEILIAALWFTAAAVAVTLVGNIVCPEMGSIAASYYAEPVEKMSLTAGQSKTGEPSVSEGEKPIILSQADVSEEPAAAEQTDKAAETETEQATSEEPADTEQADKAAETESEQAKSEEPADTEQADKAAETETEQAKSEEPAAAEQADKAAEESMKTADKAPITETELTKFMKNGAVLDLGDGRVAYKVKGGDTFSQICAKVFGTSKVWKKQAEKIGTDYRKIRPGKVLIFEKE